MKVAAKEYWFNMVRLKEVIMLQTAWRGEGGATEETKLIKTRAERPYPTAHVGIVFGQ